MTQELSLANTFLIAMPQMNDPHFQRTVTYICEHNEHGAMGIVINRPLDLHLVSILRHVNINTDDAQTNQMPILWGGPVNSDQLFTLHYPTGQWESSLHLANDVAVTTSMDILQALAQQKGPKKIIIALGYATWGAGLLEKEIGLNMWLNGPFVQEILFDHPFEDRWEAAAAALGVDFNQLCGDAGHA